MIEKKKTLKEKPVVVVENQPPEKQYASFDAFFHEFALKNEVNLKWKDSLKKHLKAIGCFEDQSKWMDGIKNFGL